MLSRVAECMLWMARYVERAENTARILDVSFRLLLDAGVDTVQDAWAPLVNLVPQTWERFSARYPAVTQDAVCHFLTFDDENPNSIRNAIGAARENARSCRESISSEMWEVLNTLYLAVAAPRTDAAWAESPQAFYRQVLQGSQHLQGATDATMPRDDGWHFIQVGKFLERADSATRILDARRHLLIPAGEQSPDTTNLIALLRSCSAYEAYRRQPSARVDPRGVLRFLLLDPLFPRSVRFCIDATWEALRAVDRRAPRAQANSAERALGLLRAQIEFADVDEVLVDLPGALDSLQRRINRVGEQVHRVYLYSHQRTASGSSATQAAQLMAAQQQQ
jgi:uncharacterized alpha-E superfamily protein